MPVTLLSSAARLDRASARRADAAYLDALAESAMARFALFDGLDPVLCADGAARSGQDIGNGLDQAAGEAAAPALWFTDEADLQRYLAQGLIAADGVRLFLGVDPATGAGHFVVRLSPQGRQGLAGQRALVSPADVRTLASRGDLTADAIAEAGLGRSLLAWHDGARFCGACGGLTIAADGGWRRHCSQCARDLYPRVDPVVIMLVTDGERCVLAHEPRFPDLMFSCIAGYVEPGEDIAHAVRRETAEELGLAVVAVEVVGAQPWPMPHSLMIGCVARVTPAAITPDPTEIDEARWFTRADASRLLDGTHPDGLWVPGAQAIANTLIRRFADGAAAPTSTHLASTRPASTSADPG